MGVLIDLNTKEDDETPSSGSYGSSSPVSGFSSSSASALASSSSSVCLDLWHACAGPLISLPKKGSAVVYFPQGHFEQVHDFPAASYNLPPHVVCRVVDVKLHAEEGSDEVYCQVSLVPENEQIEQKLQGGEINADGEKENTEAGMKMTPHMFCKTLTASDTSTHGGFSVPRRAAEDCFPPLDYSQQRPSQELVAKDLHGLEWKFRHIYRGQPRRHLLTTGWSAFVNKKKLVSGDAVLFLRGKDGELRLGIRRAAQLKVGGSLFAPCSHQLNPSTLIDVANALSVKCAFNIHYNPRASSLVFIVPVHKFVKSLEHCFSVGMRFRMQFETEDAAERRCTGLITGVSDADPVRWPGSKWKCLLVRWDDVEATRHNRVSPWEIEPSASTSSSSLMATGLKRARIGLLSSKPEFPVSEGIGTSDFGEPLRFQKVLQGQEILGVNTPCDGIGTENQHSSELRSCYPGPNWSGNTATGDSIRTPHINSNISNNSTGFGESFRFQKVLQGQEIFPGVSYERAPSINGAHEHGDLGMFDGCQVLSSRNGWSSRMQANSAYLCPSAPSKQVSSPSSVLMFQQAINPVSNYQSSYLFKLNGGKFAPSPPCEPISIGEGAAPNSSGMFNLHNQLGVTVPRVSQSAFRGSQELVTSCKSSCRLFGFSLTEEKHVANKEDDHTPFTCPLNSGDSYNPVGEHFHQEPLIRTKAIGSNRTNGSDFYAVRDMCFDIAL
ncbi:Auxin response factor [Quillaja saponaria]|uniref:Auxin response factor n=1 Tax=Quillaja saponaria TaxID=32244 RepID=A0AAD7KWE4_QUISA|nr:Auxin response factor [Quillaja saponaria]